MQTAPNIKNHLSDMVVISGRCLRHAFRSIDTLITVVAMPVVMMLLFVYVFGGAINTGTAAYINYVVPGIILMCIASGTPYTSLRLNIDVTSGFVDRFRSMPIAKSSILTGHVLTSVVFNMFSAVLVTLFAVLIGFRPEAGFAGWLLAIGILLLFTLAMTWLSVVFGLLAKSAEGARGVFLPDSHSALCQFGLYADRFHERCPARLCRKSAHDASDRVNAFADDGQACR